MISLLKRYPILWGCLAFVFCFALVSAADSSTKDKSEGITGSVIGIDLGTTYCTLASFFLSFSFIFILFFKLKLSSF